SVTVDVTSSVRMLSEKSSASCNSHNEGTLSLGSTVLLSTKDFHILLLWDTNVYLLYSPASASSWFHSPLRFEPDGCTGRLSNSCCILLEDHVVSVEVTLSFINAE